MKTSSFLARYQHTMAFLLLVSFASTTSLKAQTCPPNIDFETGTFSGWTLSTGYTSAVGDRNVITLGNSGGSFGDRHTMYAAGNTSVDPYGGFPVICPNGSGYSIKLGNDRGGGEAEGISYEFTIPENENAYSLIYHYAVVFQSPNHRENEQPRMEIEVLNVKDNQLIECASFTFISMGSNLPGFQVSNRGDTTTVLYKDWSAVSVDLSGNAGKTIRLTFKTADCTFRRHFGYAYIDVNTECSTSFVGANYCPDDTVINVIAPYGYQEYTWYDSSLTRVLGTSQTVNLPPTGMNGKTIAVRLQPYNGFGCTKTFFTKLTSNLVVKANAGRDTLSCNVEPVHLGSNAKPGLVYSWSPFAGLNSPYVANPTARPEISTSYIVTTANSGGGCLSRDTVVVQASVIDNVILITGKPLFCVDNGDSVLLHVKPEEAIQWYKNNSAIYGAQLPTYRPTTSGSYFAWLRNKDGCSIQTPDKMITADRAQKGIMYPVQYAIVNKPITLEARNIGTKALWNPATSLNTTVSFTPQFSGPNDKLYTVAIMSNSGCVTVDTQLVKTIEAVELIVPTAFTPNGDGKNDLLRPILLGVKQLQFFRVYNRWGQLLFETRKPGEGWNGIFKSTPQATQTVVWMIQGVGLDGVQHTRKGSAVLLR